MTLKNTLKNYFNSGSPDKVSKRRIAGLVIAITAVALIAALLVLTVSSIASAITNKKANAAEEGAPVSIAVETVSGSVDDINANLNSKVTLVDIGGTTIAQGDVKTLVQTNRTNLGTAEEPIYAYGNNYPASDALLIEAFTAFDKMACDFYNEAGNYKVFVSKVYNVSMQVNAAYANGLTVKLHTFDGNFENSIYEDDRYEWIYSNAANYGFVRVSNEEGNEDVFRYVGITQAKAIGNNTTLSEYLASVREATAEAPKTVKSMTSKVDGAKLPEAKIYFVPYGDSYALPNPDKYSFSASNIGDGYVITCFAK